LDAAHLRDIAAQWSRDLARIPLDRISDVYEATVIGAKYPPQSAEFGATWDAIHSDEVQQHNAGAWRADEKDFKALPSGGDGPARRAWLALTSRLEATGDAAVACNCRDARGLEFGAELSRDGDYWQCAQPVRCGFRWSVADTMNAPLPAKKKTAVEPPAAPSRVYPVEIQAAADTLNYDLDGMEPTLYNTFRGFVEWFHSRYECALTPNVMADAWPIFAQESLSAA